MIKTIFFSLCIFGFLIYLFPSIVEDSTERGENPLSSVSEFLKGSTTNGQNPKIGSWSKNDSTESKIIDLTSKNNDFEPIGQLPKNINNKIDINLELICANKGIYLTGVIPTGYYKPQFFSDYSYKTYKNLDKFYTDLDWDQVNDIKNRPSISLAYYDEEGTQFVNEYKIGKEYFQFINTCKEKIEKVK